MRRINDLTVSTHDMYIGLPIREEKEEIQKGDKTLLSQKEEC